MKDIHLQKYCEKFYALDAARTQGDWLVSPRRESREGGDWESTVINIDDHWAAISVNTIEETKRGFSYKRQTADAKFIVAATDVARLIKGLVSRIEELESKLSRFG